MLSIEISVWSLKNVEGGVLSRECKVWSVMCGIEGKI